MTSTAHSPLVFRRTDAPKGRSVSVTPENSPMEHLYYGRIRLDAGEPAVSFDTGPCEAGLICLAGKGRVSVGGAAHDLSRHDAIYIPRDTHVDVSTDGEVDLAEFRAEVEGRYPVQVVRSEEVEQTPGLAFNTGGPSSQRSIRVLIGKNVQAGRLMAGVTRSEPGNWTSWPPHEHAAMLEEIYVYYDMPPPAFGVQFVYTNTDEPEAVEVVRQGDAVLMPAGYHPNVAIPGHPMSFVWIMAAHREGVDRQYGVVNVQPDFAQGGSGLEAARK